MFLYFNKENFRRNKKKLVKAVCMMAVLGLITCMGSANLTRKMMSKETAGSVQVSAEGNWGLSFRAEGSAPVGNATADELAKYDAFYIGGSTATPGSSASAESAVGEKVIYLTFDAGYENGYTESILDTLKKHNAPACFFVVGNYLDTAPDIVKRMVAEGHTVGNHTMHHPDMSAIGTEEAFKEELLLLEEKYTEVTGQEMVKVYRPPQGKYSESNLAMAQALGYRTIFWSLAYVDWYEEKQPTHDEAFNKLIPRIHPGAIVLLHSTSKTNAEILDELLLKWEDMGYTFRSIEEL